MIFIIILRMPTFDVDYISAIESSQLIVAEKLLNGGLLYQDIWDNKPPFSIWFYVVFKWLFGSYVLNAVHIFAVFYVFFCSLFVNQLINSYRSPNELTSAPSFIYCLMICSPWYNQDVGADFLFILPHLMAMGGMVLYAIEEQKKWYYLFVTGFLCGICIGIKLQGVFATIIILLVYLFLTRPKIKDLVTILGGLILGVSIFLLPLYFQAGLPEFWDLVVLYTYDHYIYDSLTGKLTDWYSIIDFLRVYGIVGFITVISFLSLRGRRYTGNIKQRKFEAFTFIYLIGGAFLIVASGKFFFLQYVFFVAPIVVYYVTGYLKGGGFRFIKNILSIAIYISPVYSYTLYIFCTYPNLRQYTAVLEPKDYWVRQFNSALTKKKQTELLAKDLKQHKIENGIWVACYQPELYIQLGYPCGLKYGDASIVITKMDWLSINFKHGVLLSQYEDMAKVYKTFQNESPDYIIDPYGIFSEIKNHLPVLLNSYKMKKVGYYKVYYKVKSFY